MPVLCVNACHLGVCFHVFFFMLSSVFLCLLVCVNTSFWSVFLCTIGVCLLMCAMCFCILKQVFLVCIFCMLYCVCVCVNANFSCVLLCVFVYLC